MGKRKSSAPKKANESKRQNLSWNLQDLQRDIHILGDEDPELLAERQKANQALTRIQKDVDLLEVDSGCSKDFEPTSFEKDERLQEFINNSEFYISILRQLPSKAASQSCKIGQFYLKILGDNSELPRNLPNTDEFWVYVMTESYQNYLIYFEIDEITDIKKNTVVYFEAMTDMPHACFMTFGLNCSRLKNFCLIFDEYDCDSGKILVNLYALEGSMMKLSFPSEGTQPRQSRLTMIQLMSYFHSLTVPDLMQFPCTKKHDINALYEEIKDRHSRDPPQLQVSVQHPSLKPRLRDYQKQAVVWMLTKECYRSPSLCSSDKMMIKSDDKKDALHPLYDEFLSLDGQQFYYNKHVGYLVCEKPLASVSPPGGILADEMGLGKTIEVLSCILAHPRSGLPKIEPLPVLHIMEAELTEKKSSDSDKFVSPDTDNVLVDPDSEAMVPISAAADYETDKKLNICDDSQLQSQPGEQCINPFFEVGHLDQTDFKSSCKNNTICSTHIENFEIGDKTAVVTPVGECRRDHDYCITSSDVDISIKSGQCENGIGDIHMDCSESCINEGDGVLHNDVSVEVPLETDTEFHQQGSCCSDEEQQHQLGHLDNNRILSTDDISEKSGCKAKPKQQKVSKSKNSIPAKSRCKSKAKQPKISKNSVQSTSETPNIPKDTSKSKRRKNTKSSVDIASITDAAAEHANKLPSIKFEKSKPKNCDIPTTDVQAGKQTLIGKNKKLECICGEKFFDEKNRFVVDCAMCGLFQHANCVNYDLQDPYRGLYLCPHCHVIAPPVPSGATLIISPNSISHQWEEEIQKHVHEKSLKVLVYTGVNKQGFIQPQTLASQDIVILSYETLRKETDYVDIPHSNSESGRRFRNPKRFMALPSPIVAVEWWRICLDEAQMVETVTTKTADMALRLKAVNRWCVTGTPIQRSIEDLYGLLLFLGVEPYWVRYWWNDLLYKPYCYGQKDPLHKVLAEIIWRTAKQDVLDQICLPPQTEETHWLTFSPVEEHFYRRQYQDCAREAMQKLRKWTDSETKLSSLDRTTLHQLLHPLVRLRQACCHPQAVRGEFLPIHKSTLTMEELLNQLIKKARLECEESHRQLVFALNGLAALDIIEHDTEVAVDKYRSVLRSIEEHKAEIRTDELQQLHTLHNLHEILLTKPVGVPPTLRDSQLLEQANEIKTKYRLRFDQQVTQAQDMWAPVKKSLREVTLQLRKRRNWWMELLDWVSQGDLGLLLVERIREDLSDNRKSGAQSMATRFRNVQGLQYILATHLEELQSGHESLITSLQMLSREPPKELINQTVECCLRPADQILKSCPFCEADSQFKKYESKLFSFVDKGLTEHPDPEGDDPMYLVSTRRQGTWADSECERALKSIISFAKTWRGDSKAVEYGGIHIKVLEMLKKEFKCLRTLWLYLRERVSATDELDMATTRMRLRMVDEVKGDVPQPNVLELCELTTQRLKLKSDQVIYKNELKRKLGQLLYLKNLATAQTPLEGGQNPSPCPVCQRKLGSKWSVLQCGHCYCLECVRIMVEQYSFGGSNQRLKCPVCRQRTRHADISYVSTRGNDSEKRAGDVKVKGDHSTKVEGIIHCLLTIHKTKPQAKTLVFSTWPDVLEVLSTALKENSITYRSLHVHHKFQKHLDSFKHDDNVQVLLLPVHSGSNGLNLIEATHVILVEPILNMAQELQAVGRVHRIGQTRPTVVHHFLVRGTIEERMSHLLRRVQLPTNSNNSEETTLTIGEFTSLFENLPSAQDEDDEDEEEDVQETLTTGEHVVAEQGTVAVETAHGENTDPGMEMDNLESREIDDTLETECLDSRETNKIAMEHSTNILSTDVTQGNSHNSENGDVATEIMVGEDDQSVYQDTDL